MSRASALVLLLLCLSCRTVQVTEQTFFKPRPCTTRGAGGFEDVRVDVAPDVAIQVLVRTPLRPRALLVYFGGNEVRHCGGADRRLQSWADDIGAVIALVNYRGYGDSGGSPSLGAGKADAVRAYDALSRRFGGLPVIVHGQSLGSVFAITTATERRVAGVVLESPPTTARAVIDRAIPWHVKPFVRIRVSGALQREDNSRAIADVNAPLLVLVGDADPIAPRAMAERIIASAGSSQKNLVVIPGGKHGDLVRYDVFWKSLENFVRPLIPTSAMSVPSDTHTPAQNVSGE